MGACGNVFRRNPYLIAELGYRMSVQQLSPPTVEEIERDLAEFEAQYQISTADFVVAAYCVPGVDEDDAVNWSYLIEQLKFFRRIEVVSSYSRVDPAPLLENCDTTSDRLALVA